MRHRFRSARLPAWVAALLVAAPRIAEACAVCTGGRNTQTQRAYLIGSIFLSVIPLAAVGLLAWWLRRRAHQLERAAEGRLAAAQPAILSRASSAQ